MGGIRGTPVRCSSPTAEPANLLLQCGEQKGGVLIFSLLISEIPVYDWFLHRESNREKWVENVGRSGRLPGEFLLELAQSPIATLERPQNVAVAPATSCNNQKAAPAGAALIWQSRGCTGSIHNANCLAAITQLN